MDMIFGIDSSLLLFIQNNIRNDFLTPIMKAISLTGDHGGIFWIVITVIMLIINRTRKVGICVAFSMLLSGLFTNLIIKNLVDRTRPYELVDELKPLVDKPSDASFPSGHASLGFAVAIAMILSLTMIMKRKIAIIIGICIIILVAMVSFSRLYLGVHFPSDVFAGSLIGICCGISGTELGKLIIKKLPVRWTEKVPSETEAEEKRSESND